MKLNAKTWFSPSMAMASYTWVLWILIKKIWGPDLGNVLHYVCKSGTLFFKSKFMKLNFIKKYGKQVIFWNVNRLFYNSNNYIELLVSMRIQI